MTVQPSGNAAQNGKMNTQNLPAKTKDGGTSFITLLFSFVVLFLMSLLMLPTMVFLLLSMLPTLVCLFVESRAEEKSGGGYKWLCIGGLNIAGALPFLFKMWFGDNSLDGAIGSFMRVSTVVVVYGAAGIGWVFFRCIPPLVSHFIELTDRRKVVNLKDRQKKLIDKWGADVASAVPEVKK